MAIIHTVVCLLFLFIVNCKSQASFYTRGINVEALCEECDTTTGSGYVYHPKYCHLFVHCTIGQDKRLVGQVKECTRGLLWSQKVKQCVWPEESDCPTNPCFNQSLTLRDLRTCNGYFTCTDGLRLQFNCCDKNERFSEVDGRCYKDYTCNDACLPNSSNTTAKLLACDRFEYPDNKGKYLWSISGTNISMDCAAGTAFSAEMCSCTDNADFINIGLYTIELTMMNYLLIALFLTLQLVPVLSTFCVPQTVYATCNMEPTSGNSVRGTVDFRQRVGWGCWPIGSLEIMVDLTGLPADTGIIAHGFHIHEYGDLSEGCTSTGSHYNPFNRNHGGRFSRERHVGDLGNVLQDKNGNIYTAFSAYLPTLTGPRSVLGRAVVIHEKPDDLGRGMNAESKRAGNAGSRLGCCIIGRSNGDRWDREWDDDSDP